MLKEEIVYYDDYNKEGKYHGRFEILEAETEDALFVRFYEKNNSLRYCNGCYYTFTNNVTEKKYEYWLKNLSNERSFSLYYGNGIVD